MHKLKLPPTSIHIFSALANSLDDWLYTAVLLNKRKTTLHIISSLLWLCCDCVQIYTHLNFFRELAKMWQCIQWLLFITSGPGPVVKMGNKPNIDKQYIDTTSSQEAISSITLLFSRCHIYNNVHCIYMYHWSKYGAKAWTLHGCQFPSYSEYGVGQTWNKVAKLSSTERKSHNHHVYVYTCVLWNYM